MPQVKDLIEHARLQGVAYFQGKVATGNTFESARVLAIVPAIKAIEAGEITLENSLAGDITRAYAEGAHIEYGKKSLVVAVSKTLAFLLAAQHGVAMALFNAVDECIRGVNDTDVQAVMRRGAFEKLATLSRQAATLKAVPPREALLSVLNPAAPQPDKEEVLAGLFGKLVKLAKGIAEADPAKYGTVYLQLSQTADRLSSEHATQAKRNAEKKAVVFAPAPVTSQSNETISDETPDDVDAVLSLDIAA